jgi:hypothetical protein
MRDKLPEEHHIFIAALPDMRAHFEGAAQRSPDHSFVLDSIAEELRLAERLISNHGPEPRHVERARTNLIIAAEGSHYYPLVAHEFDGALEIALRHKRDFKGPGA